MEKINWLIKMVVRYKECCDEEVLNNILKAFEPKIKYYINNVINNGIDKKDNKDDLIQEIKIKIYESLSKFMIRDVDINYDTFVNNLNERKKSNDSKIEINKYIDNFYNEYKELILNNYDYYNLYYEYKLFCNENQFKKYVDTVINNLIIDLYRKSNRRREQDKNMESYYSDINVCKEIELRNIKMSEKDYNFIKLFHNDCKRMTETEVGRVLGISQQAVNKRKNRILKKYNINL